MSPSCAPLPPPSFPSTTPPPPPYTHARRHSRALSVPIPRVYLLPYPFRLRDPSITTSTSPRWRPPSASETGARSPPPLLLRHLLSLPTSLSRAPALLRSPVFSLSLSLSLSRSFSLVTTSVRWCAWLGEEGFYSFGSVLCLVCLFGWGRRGGTLRPGAFSPFLGFLLPPLTLHPAYLTKSSTAVSQGAYR